MATEQGGGDDPSNNNETETDTNQTLLFQMLQQALMRQQNNENGDNNEESDDDEAGYQQMINFYNLISYRHQQPQHHHVDDPNIRYPNDEGQLTLDRNSIFPRISLHKTLSKSASDLNKLISAIYQDEIYIPLPITSEIILFTLSLIPGIYNFEGKMSDGWASGNGCSCRLVLNDNSCVIGGCFQEIYHSVRTSQPESSFEYEVTNGTYNYMNGGIEFTKWYFPFSYQYKIWGQIVYKQSKNDVSMNVDDEYKNDDVNDDMVEDEIWFKGEWERCGQRRGGLLDMKLTNKTVVLEHAIKPCECIFFGLGSMSSYESDAYMKIDVTLLENGIVDGNMYLFGMNWEDNYTEEEVNEGVMPDNEYAYASHKIVDGEWHHFGNIVFVFDNNKETNGFFNGSYYIGEWHTASKQYATKKYANGGMLKRSTSVLSSFSTEHSNDEDDILSEDEENGNDLDEIVAASKMKNKYEERAKRRIGHFEFSYQSKAEKNKKNKTKVIQTARGAVISVCVDNENDEYDEDEEENGHMLMDLNGDVLVRTKSLSEDDDDEEYEEDTMNVE